MRPPGFTYKRTTAHCERVTLPRLAEEYGTPLYVYSAAAIRERYRGFDKAFAGCALRNKSEQKHCGA